ncbi:MAG TPA: class II aldolase/adducin family protein [Pseudolabrys sp.]|nr:class II aldolase/adducin family protein [Pseudolabrys sp.]
MNKTAKIDELITVSRELYDRKLIHAAGGNTSVRDGNFVWISQTGAELGKLTEDKIVKVDLEGNVLEGSAPSKEMGMHLAMYRAREKARAVVHVHPTYSIAYSTLISKHSNDVVPPYTMAFYVRAGRVPMIPYHPSGSHSLHEAVEALAPRHHAILLRQHGVIVAATDMATAIGVVEEVEQCCQIAVVTALKGAALTEAQCREIDALLGRSWGNVS